MSLQEKINNAKPSSWLMDGIPKWKVKVIIWWAKMKAKVIIWLATIRKRGRK